MFLTNNYATIYNLTIYSRGNCCKRIKNYVSVFPLYGYEIYKSVKPYGNMNTEFVINAPNILNNI